MTNQDVVILSAQRTPIGSFDGYFNKTATPILGGHAIRSCLEKSGLTPNCIDAVHMGCVLSAGLGQAPARQAALAAELSVNTPCVTVNKMCASALQAVIQAHDSIVAGTHRVVIAGGMENMTMAPYLIPKARFGYRYGHAQLLDHMQKDGLEDAYDQQAMGVHAEACVAHYGFSREQQDAFALTSLQRAQSAVSCGAFESEISPIMIKDTLISEDQGPQVIKAEKIPKLRAAFIKEGTITAANASSISDGAACLALATSGYTESHQLTPLARIVGHSTFAHEPSWFTTAPIHATQQLIKKINWTLDDVDLFEINEAFACVTMATIEELNIPIEKVNVNGGACVLGHPIGATGARILVTLIHALINRGLKRGIASLCIGGGEAQAIAIEII